MSVYHATGWILPRKKWCPTITLAGRVEKKFLEVAPPAPIKNFGEAIFDTFDQDPVEKSQRDGKRDGNPKIVRTW